MTFQTKIILISLALSFIVALIIIPLLRKLKVGQIERRDGPQSHLKKQGTPTMGGIIMIIALLIIGGFISYRYIISGNQENVETGKRLICLLMVTIGFGVIGLIDDLKKLIGKNTDGLKPAYKMLGLLVIAVSFVLFIVSYLKIGTEIQIPFLKTFINIPIWLYIPFSVFVLLGTTNAINLTDGIDGLSTSVTTVIVSCLTVIGVILNVKEIVVFGCILIGACLAFLIFNLHPAKVFMGDTGSLLLGGAVASMAIYMKIPLILVIIAFIPIIETISVIIQVAYFKKTGERIFKMAPIHHHFELSGWKENKIVSVFTVITLLCCILGMFSI